MNINQMSIFLSVSETNNFSKSAKEFSISQSNVSKIVSSLEKELSVSLFIRNNNQLTLTEAGIQFQNFCKTTLDQYYQLRKSLDTSEFNTEKRPISLAITTTGSYYDIYDVLDQYKETHKDTTILIKEFSLSNVRRMLLSSSVDVCITWLSDTKETHLFEGYHIVKLLDEQYIIIARGDDPDFHGLKQISIPEASRYPFIMPIDTDISEEQMELFAHYGITPTVSCQYDLVHTQYRLVAGGFGLSISYAGLEKKMKDFRLRAMSIDPACHSTLACVAAPGNPPAHIADFMDFMRRSFQSDKSEILQQKHKKS